MSILDRAELLLQAKNYSGSGDWLDESGNSHDAVPTNSPTFKAYDGTQYLWRPNVNGNKVTTPHNAAFNITGNIGMRIRCSFDDWTPAADAYILGNWTSGNNDFQLGVTATSGLMFVRYGTGSTNRLAFSSALGLTDGTTHTLRADFDISTGKWTFYVDDVSIGESGVLSTDPGSVSGSNALGVGALPTAGNLGLAGDIFWAEVYDGSTLVARMDPQGASEPFASWTGADDGLVWTVNRAASGYVSTVVDRDMWILSGVDLADSLDIADHADLDFGTTDHQTMFVAFRTNSISANQRILFAKKNDILVGTAGYALYRNMAKATYMIGDGTFRPFDDAAAATISVRVAAVAAGRRNVNTDKVEAFVDASSDGTTGDTTTATLANALPLRIGTRGDGFQHFWGDVWAVALFREALTDAEIGLVSTLLENPDAGDPTELHEDALWWWVQQYEGRWDGSSIELVGALNQINGTADKEYAEARGTYLAVDPAG